MDNEKVKDTTKLNKEDLDADLKKNMKYIKWPNVSKVCGELLSVAIGATVVSMLIAVSDEISKMIINIIRMI